MPTQIEAVTVSAEGGHGGNIQASRETDFDELLEFHQRHADVAVLFASLAQALADLPAMSPKPRGPQGVIEESGPAQLRIAIHLPGQGMKLWEGEAAGAPQAVVRIAALIEDFAAKGEERPAPPRGVYLRAWLLSSAEARSLRRESVDRQAVAASPALEAALAQPYRLLPVAPGTNPFAPLWNRFVPGRGALEVAYGRELFQIRSLVYGTQPAASVPIHPHDPQRR
jgi:hypothetical protein